MKTLEQNTASSSAGTALRLELAGAFGDIGVLFPIAIALITLNHLNPTAVFLAAGMAYILSGWYFRLPIPVQPFKAVAAIALAVGLSPREIATSGLLIGLALAVIAVTGLAGLLARLFTLPIVRGIQLGLGLLLMREGTRLIFARAGIQMGNLSLAGWELAVAGLVILLLLRSSSRVPAGLVLLGFGVLVGLVAFRGSLHAVEWQPVRLTLLHPEPSEFRRILMLLVIPQFALTFGNSIVATQNTAELLYGARAGRVTVRALAASIAIMNVLAAAIMAAPMCHGSGGVTAHYNFGARTRRATCIIGAICLLLAAIGAAALDVLRLIPAAILGVFLLYVGFQHALYLRDLVRRWPAFLLAVLVGAVGLATTNLMWAFLVGLCVETVLALKRKAMPNRKTADGPATTTIV